ncbi:hypothetical protein HLK59_04520 [Streptomyces sp. S3(2020)]|nr:hypothetical protein [Streptomyces sp. S3(2020)]
MGTSDQIGHDLAEEAYCHRHLPYRAGAAETHNPRVGKGDDAHVVRTDDESAQLSCTCFRWAKYRGGRGPRKHMLAVGMVRGTAADARTYVTGTGTAAATAARSETAR